MSSQNTLFKPNPIYYETVDSFIRKRESKELKYPLVFVACLNEYNKETKIIKVSEGGTNISFQLRDHPLMIVVERELSSWINSFICILVKEAPSSDSEGVLEIDPSNINKALKEDVQYYKTLATYYAS